MIKNIIVFLFLFYFGCNEQSNPLIPTGTNILEYNEFLNGKTRDFVIVENMNAENFTTLGTPIMIPCSNTEEENECNNRFWCSYEGNECIRDEKDMLFVANETAGFFIYEILDDLTLSLFYQNNGFEFLNDEFNEPDLELRAIEYSPLNHTLYLHDKFEFIYQIFIPKIVINDDYIDHVNCGVNEFYNPIHPLLDITVDGQYNATKMFLIDNITGTPGLLWIDKFNMNNSEYVDFSHSKVIYSEFIFPPSADACFGNGSPVGYNNNTLLDESHQISYNASDISIHNNLFVIGNASDENYSVKLYDFNVPEANYLSQLLIPYQIYSTHIQNNYIYIGSKQNGCYITLLPSDGIFDENNNIFNIADDVSVYDVHYDQNENLLILSCGSDGVLIYNDFDGDGFVYENDFKGQILASYAYKAKVFRNNKLIVGTKHGIEIFNIGE